MLAYVLRQNMVWYFKVICEIIKGNIYVLSDNIGFAKSTNNIAG